MPTYQEQLAALEIKKQKQAEELWDKFCKAVAMGIHPFIATKTITLAEGQEIARSIMEEIKQVLIK